MTVNNETFLAEYSSENAVRKYSRATAGAGIDYLLEYQYGPLYMKALRQYLSVSAPDGIRMLEFGCGAGMNLIHCLGMLQRERIPVAVAIGTDFSKRLIDEANKEAGSLPAKIRNRVKFLVARSEHLTREMASGLGVDARELIGSFHFIIGVNTFRYCYRTGKGYECAQHIYDLLKPGGVCVMIDMNRKFPMFRTLLRDHLTRPPEERYLPTLKEYGAPFESAGFEILERRHFCWIPHSAGPVLLNVCRTLEPLLNIVVPSFAMRSLVTSRKPL